MKSVLRAAPLLLLVGVFAVFSSLSSRFSDPQNILNILIQSSSLAIVSVGMTYVLLTGGIDLSVGSIMFLSAAIAGKIVLAGGPLWLALLCVLAAGLAFGAMNALLIQRFRLLPFIVTMSTLFAGRGFALYLTETRAMNLPDSLLRLGSGKAFGIAAPVWVMVAAAGLGQFVLSRTAFGRQVYAVGNNAAGAREAGIPVDRILVAVYLICGFCAALGGAVSVAQLGAVSPTFGYQREFAVIAAAVLGGTSLLGGRGSVLPGAILGAVLIQTVESGLVIVNADPYLYPMVLAAIIFVAVLLDGIRHAQMERLSRRTIRPLV